jgi:hypothetical protein
LETTLPPLPADGGIGPTDDEFGYTADQMRAYALSAIRTLEERVASLEAALGEMTEDRDRLDALVNSPETRDFLTGVRNEVAHQIERWGTVHDRAKEPADWFWLVGYLGGKALSAHVKGDTEKAMHHCISTSAALANWHAHIAHGSGLMQPGSSDLQDFLRETFGSNFIEYQTDRAALSKTAQPGIE